MDYLIIMVIHSAQRIKIMICILVTAQWLTREHGGIEVVTCHIWMDYTWVPHESVPLEFHGKHGRTTGKFWKLQKWRSVPWIKDYKCCINSCILYWCLYNSETMRISSVMQKVLTFDRTRTTLKGSHLLLLFWAEVMTRCEVTRDDDNRHYSFTSFVICIYWSYLLLKNCINIQMSCSASIITEKSRIL